MGISEQIYYVRKKRYGGLGCTRFVGSRLLEAENRRLKQLVADHSLHKLMLQDVLQKEMQKEMQDLSGGASWSGIWSGPTG